MAETPIVFNPIVFNPIVFNIVWAGDVSTHLRYFVESQIAHSDATFRFILNCCPADEIARLEAFASDHPDRIVDVVMASESPMVPHGQALDTIRGIRDDGEFFALIDSDIRANGPFVEETVRLLDGGAVGVGGGRGVWCDSDVIPEGHAGVNGEYFYDAGGFFFGSPHYMIYRREALEETADRWGVGFFGSGPALSDKAKQALLDAGHDYWLWDTGKLLNTFLQIDGHELIHHEPSTLMHIGGMSHYLSPPEADGSPVLELALDRSSWNPDRLEVAEFCAAVLVAAGAGQAPPDVPAGLDASTAEKLTAVRAEILTLVATYGRL